MTFFTRSPQKGGLHYGYSLLFTNVLHTPLYF